MHRLAIGGETLIGFIETTTKCARHVHIDASHGKLTHAQSCGARLHPELHGELVTVGVE